MRMYIRLLEWRKKKSYIRIMKFEKWIVEAKKAIKEETKHLKSIKKKLEEAYENEFIL
jgi:hypothetical protein